MAAPAVLPETIIVPARAAVAHGEDMTEVTFVTPTHLYTARIPREDGEQLARTILGRGVAVVPADELPK